MEKDKSHMDKHTVKKIANLSRIEMNEEALERMAPEIASIMQWIEQLSELDTKDVLPLENVIDITHELRSDQVSDGDIQEDVLSNAKEKTQGYYVVNKVVDDE